VARALVTQVAQVGAVGTPFARSLALATIDNERDAHRVDEKGTPRTPVIYETVRRMGEQEMKRPATSLAWSGVAAGLSISFSLLAQAILRQHLPDAPWRDLVVALGYPIGFVMVVLARQQLFTESTITVVLPAMARPTVGRFVCAMRLWAIVLAANLAGTTFAAVYCSFTPAIDGETLGQMLAESRSALAHGWLETALRAVSAGVLMAATVWLMPGAAGAQFPVVVAMPNLIGVGGFSHVVAGSTEAFLLVAQGERGLVEAAGGFLLPALLGNVIGGTALFAMISHAQVMKEI
jgi:formate/nitrite transporter FocA (FNT family)